VSVSSGRRLRQSLDAALARESDRLGMPLVFDAREQQHVDAAVRAADHVAKLQRLLNAELRGEKRASVAAKLMSEIRLQDLVVAEHVAKIGLSELTPAKSSQHQAAATARWGENRPQKKVRS
jgi:AICAR transformylase/IMP cyclohydrolase PurH